MDTLRLSLLVAGALALVFVWLALRQDNAANRKLEARARLPTQRKGNASTDEGAPTVGIYADSGSSDAGDGGGD